ncbi:MAG: hypothetical protein JRI25_04510 [Deltaproteobacteria bacterium]|nr:hypothetical protein [Deltaproteobacteria bacterium]
MDAPGFRTLLLHARLVRQVVGRRLSARLFPAWMLLVFLLSQFWDTLDWPAISAALTAQTPTAAGSTIAVLLGVWGFLWGRAVRTTLYAETLRFLWRQPLPPHSWSIALAPHLVAIGLPLALVSVLWRSPHPLLQALLWLGLWVVPALALGTRTARGAAWSLPALAVAWAGVAISRLMPQALPLLVPVTWLGVVLASGALYLRMRPRGTGNVWSTPGRPRSPLGAILRRDLLCLWRLERGSLVLCLLPPLLVVPVIGGLSRNAGLEGGDLTTAGLAALALTAPVGLYPLARLSMRLRRQLDPPTWPLGVGSRTAALFLVGCLALAPAWAGTTAATPGDPVGILSTATLWGALGAGAAALTAGAHRFRPNFGLWMWWILLTLGASVLVGWPSTLALAGLAGVATARSLRRTRGRPW